MTILLLSLAAGATAFLLIVAIGLHFTIPRVPPRAYFGDEQ